MFFSLFSILITWWINPPQVNNNNILIIKMLLIIILMISKVSEPFRRSASCRHRSLCWRCCYFGGRSSDCLHKQNIQIITSPKTIMTKVLHSWRRFFCRTGCYGCFPNQNIDCSAEAWLRLVQHSGIGCLASYDTNFFVFLYVCSVIAGNPLCSFNYNGRV